MSQDRRRLLALTALQVALSGFGSGALAAEGYPSRPITIVVPFGAGSSPDTALRTLVPGLQQSLGASIVVDNRPGAAGNIGAAQVAKASPDGYTLLYTVNSVLCANPHLYRRLPFEGPKSFAPVAFVGELGYVLMGRADLPVSTLPELLKFAKANPGRLSYGSAGLGSGNHVVMELLSGLTGTAFLHVPSKLNTIPDLLGGHIDLSLVPYTTGIPAAKAGKLKAFAVTLGRRSRELPELPAVGETVKGFVGDGWHAVFAPAGTPAALIERLNAAFVVAQKQSEARARLESLGIEVIAYSPSELGARVANDFDKWGKVIRDANIKLDE